VGGHTPHTPNLKRPPQSTLRHVRGRAHDRTPVSTKSTSNSPARRVATPPPPDRQTDVPRMGSGLKLSRVHQAPHRRAWSCEPSRYLMHCVGAVKPKCRPMTVRSRGRFQPSAQSPGGRARPARSQLPCRRPAVSTGRLTTSAGCSAQMLQKQQDLRRYSDFRSCTVIMTVTKHLYLQASCKVKSIIQVWMCTCPQAAAGAHRRRGARARVRGAAG